MWRSRTTRRRWGAGGIATLATASLLLVAACSTSGEEEPAEAAVDDSTAATETTGPTSSTVPGAAPISVFELEVGTCFDDPAFATTVADDEAGTTTTTAGTAGDGSTTTSTTAASTTTTSGAADAPEEVEPTEVGQTLDVPCFEPHDAEVYAIVQYAEDDDADFPGEDELREEADAECLDRFEPFVGTPYVDSTLDLATIWPTEASWDQGDRSAVCSVFHRDLEKLEGTMDGAGV